MPVQISETIIIFKEHSTVFEIAMKMDNVIRISKALGKQDFGSSD